MNITIVKLGLLREVLTNPHAHSLTKGSPTHEPGLKFSKALLPIAQDEDQIYGLFENLLPQTYTGNLMSEVRGMVRDGIAKGMHERTAKDDADKKQSEIAIDAANAGGLQFFVSPLGQAYAKVPGKHGGVTNLPVRSKAFKDVVRRAYFLQRGEPAASSAITDAIDHFEAMAQFDSPAEPIYIRVASHEGAVYYDLADDQNRAVKVTVSGWSIVNEVPVNFVRPNGSVAALPVPVKGGKPEELRQLLGMDQTNFLLFLHSASARSIPKAHIRSCRSTVSTGPGSRVSPSISKASLTQMSRPNCACRDPRKIWRFSRRRTGS